MIRKQKTAIKNRKQKAAKSRRKKKKQNKSENKNRFIVSSYCGRTEAIRLFWIFDSIWFRSFLLCLKFGWCFSSNFWAFDLSVWKSPRPFSAFCFDNSTSDLLTVFRLIFLIWWNVVECQVYYVGWMNDDPFCYAPEGEDIAIRAN